MLPTGQVRDNLLLLVYQVLDMRKAPMIYGV